MGTAESPNNQIARAVSWLREHYRELFSLAELAAQVNMSQPSLCRHFSRITGTSLLQFQKRLRLHEAQRLMLTEGKSAETAAYEVGYDSPTQFNREYKRQFGGVAAPGYSKNACYKGSGCFIGQREKCGGRVA
ncbi:MAG: AraC family transcriptional regulator [Spirochaetaceae bacterium]|nr:AraC family transcriptional regulator [Spirochaetaceae bacterium]